MSVVKTDTEIHIFSLVDQLPNSTRLSGLDDVAADALTQRLHLLANEHLSQITVLELPKIPVFSERREPLGLVVRKFFPDQQYAFSACQGKCYLIDKRIAEQWLCTYESAYHDEDGFHLNEDLSESDSIQALLYPERVEISSSNYHALVDVALLGKCSVLSQRLDDFCVERLLDLYEQAESSTYTTASDFRVLKKAALALSKLRGDLLQRMWDRWVKELGSEPPSQYSGEEQGKLMAQLFSASPLVVDKLTARVEQVLGSESCPFQDLTLKASTELLGEMPEAGKLFNVRNFVLPFALEADELNEFLECMPCLRTVRLQLSACDDHEDLETAFSHLYFIEQFDLTIQSPVTERYTDVLCENILRWPIKDLSITASTENAATISGKLSKVISNLVFLKKLSISGMEIPSLSGLDQLEVLSIQGVPEGSVGFRHLAALKDEAPRLQRLDLEGTVYEGPDLMKFFHEDFEG